MRLFFALTQRRLDRMLHIIFGQKKIGHAGRALMMVLALHSVRCEQFKTGSQATPQSVDHATEKKRSRQPAVDSATLMVTALPSEGITVLVDGERVADRSPCEVVGLAPGNHLLEVRGMGRYSVTVPVDLRAGQVMKIPVSLRSRPPRPFDGSPAARTADASPSPETKARTRVPTAPEPQSPPVVAEKPRALPNQSPGKKLPIPSSRPTTDPRFLAPVWLSITAQPAAPIVVDGQPADGITVQLTRTQGVLIIGTMTLPYTLLPGQVAALTIPHESGRWFVGETPIKAKSVVRIGRSPIPLRRIGPGAEGHQEAVLRRHL